MLNGSFVITPRRTNKNISSSSIQKISRFSDPITPLKQCFSDFSEKFEFYFSLFPQRRMDPNFMVQYKRLSKAFDLFYHQYSHRQEHSNSNRTSPLFLFGKSLTDDWVEFIRYYIVFANTGTAAQISEINSSFDTLYLSLKELRGLMNDIKFKTDVGCNAMLKVQADINSIRKDIQHLFIRSDNEAVIFNEEQFTNKMKELGFKISTMFMKSLTHQCLKKGDKYRINANMNAACASIKENVINAMILPTSEFETRSAIDKLNNMLSNEFNELKIPFGVKIDYENCFRNKIATLLGDPEEDAEP